ncbi:hypothetical protein JHK86_027806 [Glycine max]|nr:hypothetical protein JHK86_027806 [Glycine max]
MQAMYGVKVETVFICRVLTAAFSGSSKKLSDLNVADIHSWALDFRRLQNLVNEEIRVRFSGGKFTVLNELEAVDASAGVDTVEIEWLLKTFEELRAGAEKLSQVNDLLAKVVDGFFEAVMTSRDTLLSSVRFDKTVNDRSPGPRPLQIEENHPQLQEGDNDSAAQPVNQDKAKKQSNEEAEMRLKSKIECSIEAGEDSETM